MTKQRKRKKRLRFWIWIVLILISLFLLIFSIVQVFKWKQDNEKTKQQLDTLEDEIKIEEVSPNDTEEIVNADENQNSDYYGLSQRYQ